MERVLVIGAGSGGQVLVQELRDNPRWKLWPVAYVDDDRRKLGRVLGGVPVLGDTDALGALVAAEAIDVVVIAIPSAPSGDHARLIAAAERRGCVCPPEIPVCVCGRNPRLRLVTRPSITPSADEIAANPRARSAVMRVAERVARGGAA